MSEDNTRALLERKVAWPNYPRLPMKHTHSEERGFILATEFPFVVHMLTGGTRTYRDAETMMRGGWVAE